MLVHTGLHSSSSHQSSARCLCSAQGMIFKESPSQLKLKKKKAQLLKYRLPTFITHMTRNTEKECHEDFWSHYSKWRTIQSIQCLTKLAHCPLFCSSFSYLKGNFQKNKYSDELKDDRSTQSLVYLKNNQDPTL